MLVFGHVLDTTKEIKVRFYSVGKEINKIKHFKDIFDVKSPKSIFKYDDKYCLRISLKSLSGFFPVALDV